jgi:hypothetical protein
MTKILVKAQKSLYLKSKPFCASIFLGFGGFEDIASSIVTMELAKDKKS